MRWTKQNTLFPFLVLLILSIPLLSLSGDIFTGKVVGVSDGDTSKVMRKGKAVKVRLHGIDCPERKQSYGTRAKQYISHMAFGKEVTVQVKTTDRYGRTVGEVILPGALDECWSSAFALVVNFVG